MSGQQLIQSEYAQPKSVELFGDLLFHLAEAHITHTYCVVFCFCERENIDYLVSLYLNNGA
jgi:hypothetical protein